MSALTFTGDGLLARFASQLAVLGANAPIALSRALNHIGVSPPTQVIRNLTKQTGLKRSVIVKGSG
ncbi:hypothetical protein BHAOGJBA_3923 [Methylobacterium hispanicum]|uniref:Uncharacterized protein n=1 Tax=Methylobacterium hispanicum TaxID=270350 RepID=A0AAV4ZQG0_9HYPH|nr:MULTISPECIES: hypothetical protein [Methylobacterium]GJD90384.1 hypothetical protein BHAOGJBA_3923 [Methylobacterium hispanicum]